jgi:hypothetical protein
MHACFERMIGTALVDKNFARTLLSNPRATAITFGASAADADKIADIHVMDLASFAQALQSRIYGPAQAQHAARYATGC